MSKKDDGNDDFQLTFDFPKKPVLNREVDSNFIKKSDAKPYDIDNDYFLECARKLYRDLKSVTVDASVQNDLDWLERIGQFASTWGWVSEKQVYIFKGIRRRTYA